MQPLPNMHDAAIIGIEHGHCPDAHRLTITYRLCDDEYFRKHHTSPYIKVNYYGRVTIRGSLYQVMERYVRGWLTHSASIYSSTIRKTKNNKLVHYMGIYWYGDKFKTDLDRIEIGCHEITWKYVES